MTLEERIDGLLMGFYTHHSDVIVDPEFTLEQKDKLLTLITEETVKAKSDELKRIERANIDNGINFLFEDMKPQNNGWRNMKQYVPDRIAQLKAELKQSNNKDT